MSRVKLTLLIAAAVVVAGAFASASASATTPVFSVCLKAGGSGTKYEESKCEKEKTGGEWEVIAIKEALAINGTGGVAKLKGILLKAEILITCKKDKVTGEIEPAGKSKGETTFEGCEAGNSSGAFKNCAVPNIKFKFIDQLVENAKGEVEDEFKPSGSIFVEIIIENKEEKVCAEKGKFPVGGTQNAELEQTGHKTSRSLTYKPSGSHLTFDGEPATFENTASVVLNNGDSWGVSIP
jgi:hypothetical protein